jgi:hypothetical protein
MALQLIQGKQISVNLTGSFTGSFSGSLFGTASFAISSSNSISSSFATNSTSASFAVSSSRAVSASFATTASIVQSIANNITNNVDNYILTATGGSTINGEVDLTFDGGLLNINGQLQQGEGVLAIGDFSHAEGYGTVAFGSYQHVQGQFNISSSVQSAFIHGNGEDENSRSNLIYAHDSIVEITGSLKVSGSITGSLFGTASYALNINKDTTIISGSTNAVQGGAVFGALALKEDKVAIFVNTTTYTSTIGTTSEQIISSNIIPANSIEINSVLKLASRFNRNVAGNTASIKFYLSTVNNDINILNATLIGTFNGGLNVSPGLFEREYAINSSSVLSGYPSSISATSDNTTYNTVNAAFTLPITLSTVYYLISTITPSATGALEQKSISLLKFK